MLEDSPHIAHSRWRLFLTLGTFIALVVLIYSVRRQIADVITGLGQINAVALLLIIPIELANYDLYARLYRDLFATLGSKADYRRLYRITLELNFINHILPSGGVSGISYFSLRTRSEGISAGQATFVQFMKLFLLYLSYQPLLILGLLFLAIGGHVNDLILVVTTFLITLLVVGTLIAIYIAESLARVNAFFTGLTKSINWLIHLVRPKHPETINVKNAQKTFLELYENYQLMKAKWRSLKLPFLYMLLANATEVAALYVVYIAYGRLVNIGAVILAYAVASFAGLMSVLPAGIGVYEGLMTGVLAATGIPAALSIPVTLTYRVVSMAVQLIPGYIFYQRSVHEGLGRKPK